MNSKLSTQNAKLNSAEQDPTARWLRSWPRLYALVLGELAVLIILFYLFTKAFE